MRVTANGCAMHVSVRGADGPALVFLHYFAGSSRTWDEVVARLEGEYRCIAVDLRGFGDSAGPPDGYTVADGADDVAALVEQLALDRYALVGHSMGGKIALVLAARRPPRLGALVLVAPSPPTPEPMADADRAQLLATHGDRAAAAATVHRIVACPLPARLHERAVADNVRTSRRAWRAWLERGSREDIVAAASGITAPTLVVGGAADPVVPPDLLEREVVRRVAGARMVVMPDVGHLVPLEAPIAVADAIRAHWPAGAARQARAGRGLGG